ncbi:hypothetical protein B0H10DRAFT_1939042 [Mycena sp. CBHHK59/15]|nr:hypothetical protein B0H10DRAFT_1939042 [Mycena sp. CBHHK59/15]
MVIRCRQCPTREFGTKTALSQHYRMAPGHCVCVDCDRYFSDEETYIVHRVTAHPQFECTTCNCKFVTQSSLEDHYKGKAIHPNCPRCGKGFKEQKDVNKHYKATHPRTLCPCGGSFYIEDLAAHYLGSPDHRSCVSCNVGFKDDTAYDEHATFQHPERQCAGCGRHFSSREELKLHLSHPLDHPSCSVCASGLKDDAAYDAHAIVEHPEQRCNLCRRLFRCHEDIQKHFFLSPEHPKCFRCNLGFLNEAHSESTDTQRTLNLNVGVVQDVLGISGNIHSIPAPEARGRPSLLPRPGSAVNEIWKAKQNTALLSSLPALELEGSTNPLSRASTPSSGSNWGSTTSPPQVINMQRISQWGFTEQHVVSSSQTKLHAVNAETQSTERWQNRQPIPPAISHAGHEREQIWASSSLSSPSSTAIPSSSSWKIVDEKKISSDHSSPTVHEIATGRRSYAVIADPHCASETSTDGIRQMNSAFQGYTHSVSLERQFQADLSFETESRSAHLRSAQNIGRGVGRGV